MDYKTALQRVRNLLSDRSNWTQGQIARDSQGRRVAFDSEDAVCWCLSGALFKVLSFSDTPLGIFGVVERNFPTQHMSTPDFNDSSTHEEVLAVLDKTISSL